MAKHTMKKPVALVDMDGTLCDFRGAMERDLAKLRSPEETEPQDWDDKYHPPHLKARWNMIKRQPNWWLNLELIPAGFMVLNALKSIGYALTCSQERLKDCHRLGSRRFSGV